MKNKTSNHKIIQTSAAHVRRLLAEDGAGHDWWHVARVRALAIKIGRKEKADLFTVELAALLHDIADWKFHEGDDTAGPRAAEAWLRKVHAPESVIREVCDIIATLSFKGAGVNTPMKTLEGRAVQDADRLDAMGAIGIARAFAYGGAKGRLMHDPEKKPEAHGSFSAYKKAKGTTINHFYEKLLLLKERMNTKTGRELAKERHAYMKGFLKTFYREWEP